MMNIEKKACFCKYCRRMALWDIFLCRLACPKGLEPTSEPLKRAVEVADKLTRALKRRGLSQDAQKRIARLGLERSKSV